MATEPGSTSPNYDPLLTYTPPVGRLPILGRVGAEIAAMRASAANDRNQIDNRDLLSAEEKLKLVAETDAIGRGITLEEAKQTHFEAYDILRYTNVEKAKVDQEVLNMAATLLNENAMTTSNTGKIDQEKALIQAQTTQVPLKASAEIDLLVQKKETERAQTEDFITAGEVVGVVGKQKDLFQRQADGFLRDAEQKLTKILLDTWNTRFTIEQTADVAQAGITDLNIRDVINDARKGLDIGLDLGPYTP